MRVFIALEIPDEIRTSLRKNLVSDEIKKKINKIQRDLKKTGVQAHWVKPELSHLTLAFLGSITPDKVKPISKILDEVARQIKPVQLHLLKIGCFPSPVRTKIIFVELGGELGKLNALAIKIRKRLKKERIWFDEKPFVSHITLGRIRKGQNLTKLIKKIKIKKVKFIASEVSLTQSTLTKSGPIYSKLKSTFLD